MSRRYRKAVVAANWKMNTLPSECRDFILGLKERMAGMRGFETILCVPFTHIPAAVKAAKGTRITIGAQNCHFADKGAYTGEISCKMIGELGAKYVIVGHSERRKHFGETDADVNRKVHTILEEGMRPIICLGESSEIRDAGAALDLIRVQLRCAIKDVEPINLRKTMIAYEPLWAIGTGVIATPDQAEEAVSTIRDTLRSMYGARVARCIPILYGGSLNEGNADNIFRMPNIDGGLVGGASLEVNSFAPILDSIKRLYGNELPPIGEPWNT